MLRSIFYKGEDSNRQLVRYLHTQFSDDEMISLLSNLMDAYEVETGRKILYAERVDRSGANFVDQRKETDSE